MAISTNGGSNPTEVIYNGKQCTEVWWKSTPSATAIKVWPDVAPTAYRFEYQPGVWAYQPTGFSLSEGQAKSLNTTIQQYGYPKSNSSSKQESKVCTVYYSEDYGQNYRTVATPYVLTTNTVTTTNSYVASYNLTYKSGDSYLNLRDKSGRNYIGIGSSFTCPTIGFDKETYSEPYYFVPTFRQNTSTSSSSSNTKVYYEPSLTKDNKRLYLWRPIEQPVSNHIFYCPSHELSVSRMNGKYLTAIWVGPYNLSWTGLPAGLRLLINNISYTNSSGSAQIVMPALDPDEFIVSPKFTHISFRVISDGTAWSFYKDGKLKKTFTDYYDDIELDFNYNTATLYSDTTVSGALTFDLTNHRINLTETIS